MKNTPLTRSIFLFVAVSAIMYNILFCIKIYYHPGSVGPKEMFYGYWTLPIAVVFLYLYSYLNKKR